MRLNTLFIALIAGTTLPATLAPAVPVGTPAGSAARPATPEELVSALRRGLFVQVVEEGARIYDANTPLPIHGTMAVAYAALNDVTASDAALARAAALAEPGLPLHESNSRALLALHRGELGTAAGHAEQAMHLDKRDPVACLTLAQVAYVRRDLTSMLRWSEQALALEPAMAPAHFFRGLALHGQGKTADALHSMARAAESDPRDLRPRSAAAEILVGIGRLDDAAAVYRELLKIKPDAGPRAQLARVLMQAGRLEEAAAESGTLLAEGSHSTDARMMLAAIHTRRGDAAAARAQLAELARENPDSAPVHAFAGVCWTAAGERESARASFERSLTLSPGTPTAAAGRAVLEQLSGAPDKASSLLALALAKADGSLAPRLHFHRAILALQAKDWNGARQAFRDSGSFVVNLRPDLVDWESLYADAAPESIARLNAGVLFLSENLPEVAAAEFARARAGNASDVLAMFLGANLAARRLDYDESLRLLDSALQLQPAYWPATYAKGEIRLSRGDPQGAAECYLRVLELDPANEPARVRMNTLTTQTSP